MAPQRIRRLTLILAGVYALLGTLEVVLRLTAPDFGVMAFLGGTQLVGALLILAGLFGSFRDSWRQPMIIGGTLAGLIATAWTVVIPVLALTVVFLNVRGSGDTTTTDQ